MVDAAVLCSATCKCLILVDRKGLMEKTQENLNKQQNSRSDLNIFLYDCLCLLKLNQSVNYDILHS